MTTDWLAGQTALVTGASSGIGEAIAHGLANAGARVVVTARRADRLNALARALDDSPGGGLALPADARDESQLVAVFDEVRRRWDGVDILVNSAGLGRVAPLMSGDTEAWREMLEVNVLALAVCTREAIQDMRRRGDRGQVVHVSSMSGHRVPTGTGGMYSATKHAVRAMTEALRRELRAQESQIRVAAVSPGYVETEFAAVMSGSEERARATYARFACLQPVDVCEAVLHILRQPPHVEINDVLMRPTAQPS